MKNSHYTKYFGSFFNFSFRLNFLNLDSALQADDLSSFSIAYTNFFIGILDVKISVADLENDILSGSKKRERIIQKLFNKSTKFSEASYVHP